MSLSHCFAGRLHSFVSVHEERFLIPDDIAEPTIDHGLFLPFIFLF
jgi:hypothetical protein